LVLLAQLGDLVEARRFLAMARAEKKLTYTANIEALILTREGKYAEAEAAYTNEWPDLERALSAAEMRVLRARRAFALEMAGGESETVRRLVEAARSEIKGELAYAGAAWDEMGAFLERQMLV
jgi:hypothetical protein